MSTLRISYLRNRAALTGFNSSTSCGFIPQNLPSNAFNEILETDNTSDIPRRIFLRMLHSAQSMLVRFALRFLHWKQIRSALSMSMQAQDSRCEEARNSGRSLEMVPVPAGARRPNLEISLDKETIPTGVRRSSLCDRCCGVTGMSCILLPFLKLSEGIAQVEEVRISAYERCSRFRDKGAAQ